MLRQMAIKLKIILSICKYLSQDQIILIEIYPQLIRMLLDTNEKNTPSADFAQYYSHCNVDRSLVYFKVSLLLSVIDCRVT